MAIIDTDVKRVNKTNRDAAAQYSVACQSYGVPVCIESDSVRIARVLPNLLPHGTDLLEAPLVGSQHFRVLEPWADRGYRLYIDDQLLLETADADTVLAHLSRDLMVHVANYATSHVFLHAGVVAWNGRALVLPGPSLAGKSTLVSALLKRGASYYSDEYAVLDATGSVHSYARDLQMRTHGAGLEQHGVQAAAFGAITGTDPVRVAHVVFATYVKDTVCAIEEISPGMAVLEMLRHAIPVQRTPARVMNILNAMMHGASAWKTERGESDDAAIKLLSLMEQP